MYYFLALLPILFAQSARACYVEKPQNLTQELEALWAQAVALEKDADRRSFHWDEKASFAFMPQANSSQEEKVKLETMKKKVFETLCADVKSKREQARQLKALCGVKHASHQQFSCEESKENSYFSRSCAQ